MSDNSHEHKWVEIRRVTEPDGDGIYTLKLWDERNFAARKVPSIYFECECGDSLISPIDAPQEPTA